MYSQLPLYLCAMKLTDYARQQGISYKTAWRWWRAGTIKGYQAPTGTIIVTDDQPQSSHSEHVAVYARVSSVEQKDDLARQAVRLSEYCAARGYQVAQVV